MENSIETGIAKLRRAVSVRAVQRAAMAGTVLPVGDTLETLLPTSIYIATVSLLDESLEQIVDSRHPSIRHKNLNDRILALAASDELKDPSRLHSIRCKRNSLAHDSNSFASWDEVEALFEAVEEELKHLGVTA